MSTRSRAVQVLAATAVVGLVPVALAMVHLPTAQAPTVQPAATLAAPPYSTSWIAIRTAPNPSITLNKASGQVGAQQLAPASNCGVAQGAASSRYLTLTGATDTTPPSSTGAFSESLASFASGSIGVKEKKTGTSCYRVDSPSEAIDLKLGAAVPSGLASSAYLDLELKQSARILATAKVKGVTQATFELQSGASVGQPALATTTPAKCTGSADSGPDSGINDNCRWAISAPSWGPDPDDGIFFDELVLSAVSGSFSLEGGSDGSVLPQAPLSTPDASIIEVVDGTLACGTTTTTIFADADKPRVNVYRLGNADGTTCTPVPYTLATAPGYAQFIKPLSQQTSAQFIWDLVWPSAVTPGTTKLPDLKIDFEIPSPGTTVSLGWCPDPRFDSTGRFAGYTSAQIAALPDQEPDFPGTQFACVISRSAHPVDGDPDTVVSNDLVYVYGDAGMRN